MSSDVERARGAIEALESAYRAVFAKARPGTTAEQIDAILRDTLAGFGVQLPADKTRITPFIVDPAGEGPKLRLNRKPLETGRLWGMDNSVERDGFWADLGRYGWLGPLPAKVVEDYNKVLARQQQVASVIRAGVPMGKMFAAAGPGLRFEVHRIAEEPNMLPFLGDMMPNVREGMEHCDREGLMFEPGQVICIELWAGLMGGIEDMYLVTDRGTERLSTLPQELRVLAV
jgi:Xaa-Pro aminopeptidase